MKIILGYDGSDNAKRALARTIELSRDPVSELVIIYHVDLEAFETFAAKRLLAEFRNKMIDDAEKLVEGAAGLAKQGGVTRVRTLILEGRDPADALLSASVREAADLIVVGRRGIRGIERFILGSVSSRIVDHAKSDVLVVR